jgi:hypothetical protein
MCLAPGATVAGFGVDNRPMTVQERSPRSFTSTEAATAYARSLGQPAVVINEGNTTIAVYLINQSSFGTPYTTMGRGGHSGIAHFPFKGRAVFPDITNPTEQTNVTATYSGVEAIVTEDGYQLRPGTSGMMMSELAQGEDQQAIAQNLQRTYAGHREAFGEGLQDIKDKDQFLKQYNLALRDTAFNLLAASELEAKQKQQSFENGLPATEAPKIHSVSRQLEDLDQQLEQAKRDRMAIDIAAGQSNQGMAIAALVSGDARKHFEEQLKAQQVAHDRVQQLEQQRKAVLAQYPLLARVNPAEFNQLSEQEQAKVLHEACGEVLEDIAATRKNLMKGKINLWQLTPLIHATNEGLGIQPQQAEWIAEKASSEQKWDIASKIGLGALALGLGIAATIATGGLALALGIGAVAVGGIDATLTTEEYFRNQAATNTDINPEESLMPQDMKGHWGWVVASWVGAGLDIGAAVKAARLLKAGMQVDEVIEITSKTHNISADALRAAYEASGTASSDPKVLKQLLTSALPREIAQQTQQGLKVTVLEPAEFFERFGSASSDASTVLHQGKNGLEVEVFVRKGADPVSMMEEAAHIAQTTDKSLTDKMAKLSEENLANWAKMTPEQQAELYKTKLELEIDAQNRLLRQFGEGDPAYAKSVQQTLENLETRLAEVDLGLKNPESLKGKPWLDPTQPPRLFSKTPMSDKQLLSAVEKGFSNPQHMAELLARTDLSPAQLEKAREALSVALRSGKYTPENLQAIISKLRAADAKNAFDEVLAEISHSNRLVKSGQVAEGSQVVLGAKQGKEYKIGSQTVKIDPVPEADVLYLGTDGKIHLDEVKNTAHALREKLSGDSEQFKKLREWKAQDSQGREISFSIENEQGWIEVFAQKGEEVPVLEQLKNTGVSLSIGSRKLSPEQMQKLWDAVKNQHTQMRNDGSWKGWKDFYNQISTLSDAERFLGVSL